MSTKKDGARRGAAKAIVEDSNRPPAKWRRTLRALIERPTLHRFDAERDPDIRDHCLPSTVAELESRGLCIARRLVEVAGHRGERARIAEYRLDDENRARARDLLARDADHRGA